MPPDPLFKPGEKVYYKGEEYTVLYSKLVNNRLYGYKIYNSSGIERFLPQKSLKSKEDVQKNPLKDDTHNTDEEHILEEMTEPEWKYYGFDSPEEHEQHKMFRRSEMNTEELIKLADLLDVRGEHESANKIDELIKKSIGKTKAVETIGENETKCANTLHPVFEKLSSIADDLDIIGEMQGADMIDAFLNRYADEDIPKPTANTETNLDIMQYILDGLGEIEQKMDANGVPGADTGKDKIAEMRSMIIKYSAHAQEKPKLEYDLNNLKEEGFLTDEDIARMLEGDDEDQGYIDHKGRLHPPKETDETEGLDPSASKEVDAIKEELERLRSSSKPKLSKWAVDWKEEADTEQSKRYDSEYHHSLQVREPKGKQERVDREGREEYHMDTYKPHEGTLQTRYCPNHIGVQMGRVGESTYQCSIDGKIYNFETGYTDFNGNQVPGGSVAGQTPNSTGYEIPHRIFDSRSKVLNVVN